MKRLLLVGLLIQLMACAENPYADFDRHRMSWLVMPASGDTMVFQARTSPAYPSDTPEGEAVRRQWISDWLERRAICPRGYTILDGPRPFHSHEDNPHQAQLRYELKCGTTTSD